MSVFPTGVSTDADLSIAVNNLACTLNGTINDSVTTITVNSTTGFPTAGYITIDTEIIKYTSTNGTQFLGCTRGADGSTNVSHSDLTAVYHNIIAAHHNALKDEVKAIEQNISDRLGLGSTDINVNAGDIKTVNKIITPKVTSAAATDLRVTGGLNSSDINSMFVGSNGDVWTDTTSWVDYSATSTIVGWSGYSIRQIWYKRIGKLIYLSFSIAGTSNSTTTTFTLPYSAVATLYQQNVVAAVDNGTPVVGTVYSNPSSSTITLTASISGSAFTGSGSKSVTGQLVLQVA